MDPFSQGFLFFRELSHAEKMFLVQASASRKRIMIKLKYVQCTPGALTFAKSKPPWESREPGAPLHIVSLRFFVPRHWLIAASMENGNICIEWCHNKFKTSV